MDNYFLWIPLICIILAFVFCFLFGAHMATENSRKNNTGSAFCVFLVGLLFFTFGELFVYENGHGKPILIEQEAILQRLMVGETYVVVGVTEEDGGPYYLLKGKDGVRFYTSKEAVPKKFIVQKDYVLKEIE